MHIHVAYSTDDNYAIYAGISMQTLFKHNTNTEEITIHILDNGITEKNKENLKEIAKKYNRNIEFYKLQIEKQIGMKINNSYKKLAVSAYGRLFLSSLLMNIERVIYYDCDSVINGSLKNLWKEDLKDSYCAGVLDNCSIMAKTMVGLKKNDIYVNSGFLIFDLEKMRENNMEEKMIEFLLEKNGDVYHHDQGVINSVFRDRIKVLHPKYNAMTPYFDMDVKKIKELYQTTPYYTQDEFDEAKKNPIFIHYTPSMSKRPWIKGCKHPLAKIYIDALERSPWKGTLLHKDNRKKRIIFMEKIYNNTPYFLYKGLSNLLKKIKELKRS